MKVVIIGASGLIGGYLLKEFSDDFQIVGTSRSNEAYQRLDISKKKQVVSFLKKVQPDVVIVAAAMPFVDYCETHEKETDKINFLGITYICDYLAQFLPSTTIIFLSSDYVFDGEKGKYKESDIRKPLNVYGRQKMKAENYIQKSKIPFLIIRTNWVYGAERVKKNFVYAVIKSLENKQKMQVASDQIANPTYAGDIARGIYWLVTHKKQGIFHIAGKDFMSRYVFAQKIAEKFQLDKSLLCKIKTVDMHQIAQRPLVSGLSTGLFSGVSHLHCLGVEDGLDLFERDQKLLI
ncbi:MAG TPA: SDR family oxidoreductase [Patescibacteria group bacterium]|nr:SDR family oxidoreductase [Patescibacteria group bacterium]